MGFVIRKMKVDDIVDVKGVDLLSWSDLFEKSYGSKTNLTQRTDENILSYLHADPEGAFVASDNYAGVVGLVFSHVWGATGWVGPLSVLPEYQARGLGKDLLRQSLNYLEDLGCVDIGLETMPENALNLGLYLKVGLRPETLVLIVGKKIEPEGLQEEPVGGVAVERFSESSVQSKLLSEFRRVSGALRLGLDYTKEVELVPSSNPFHVESHPSEIAEPVAASHTVDGEGVRARTRRGQCSIVEPLAAELSGHFERSD